jgi:hypothetical protein
MQLYPEAMLHGTSGQCFESAWHACAGARTCQEDVCRVIASGRKQGVGRDGSRVEGAEQVGAGGGIAGTADASPGRQAKV